VTDTVLFLVVARGVENWSFWRNSEVLWRRKNVVCEQKGMASGCGSAKVVVIVELNFLLASCCCQGCRCCCCGGGDRE
jgi:hypothetical protein